jgi:hypothetical protein
MSALREAFRSGCGPRETPSIDTQADKGTPGEGTFEVGAAWVGKVLSPEVDRANFELEPEKVALRLDVNLDPRSTNHAHADLWFCELGEGHRRTGAKYSLNVVNRKVWLYKTGAPGMRARRHRGLRIRCNRSPYAGGCKRIWDASEMTQVR